MMTLILVSVINDIGLHKPDIGTSDIGQKTLDFNNTSDIELKVVLISYTQHQNLCMPMLASLPKTMSMCSMPMSLSMSILLFIQHKHEHDYEHGHGHGNP
jgi:hypothetical protein